MSLLRYAKLNSYIITIDFITYFLLLYIKCSVVVFRCMHEIGTAILLNFCYPHPSSSKSTEDAYKIRIRIDDEPANLDILDTAGQVCEQ